MEKQELKFYKINPQFSNVPLPTYQTEGSAGMDICAALQAKLEIPPGKVVLVPTNLKVEIPKGYELQVRPRSGLALKSGIGLLNSPGTIDCDYRGEIGIIMFNFSENSFEINSGDRIAQLVLAKVARANIVEVENLTETKRDTGGFGSTGI